MEDGPITIQQPVWCESEGKHVDFAVTQKPGETLEELADRFSDERAQFIEDCAG